MIAEHVTVPSPAYDDGQVQCWVGDALEVLQTMPAHSVHCVITSPPYWGLRDYGVEGQLGLEPTPEAYVEHMVAVFREVSRVLRTDGTLWLNMGDSYAASRSGPVGEFSTLDGSDVGQRAYREAVAASRYQQRSHTRERFPSIGVKTKDLIGLPWRLAFALQADGWWLRSDIIWCLSGSTRAYVRGQGGDTTMTIKDLARLRAGSVSLWDGEAWVPFLGASRSKGTGALTIELRSGELLHCTPHHEWLTGRGRVPAEDLRVGDILATTVLPTPERPLCPEALPDRTFGRLVGLYIAEGTLEPSDMGFRLSCHAREVEAWAALTRPLAESVGGTVHAHRYGNGGVVVVESSVLVAAILEHVTRGRQALRRLRSLCWRRSDAFLAALVAGYLEGGGHWEEANRRWRLGFARDPLLGSPWADDLRTLAARLGYRLSLRPAMATAKGIAHPVMRGELRTLPCRPHPNERSRSEVVAIRPATGRGVPGYWHIGVGGDRHAFALASGVLTGNSKPNPMPESVTDRPTKSHEYLFLLTKSERYFYDAEAIREASIGGTPGEMDGGPQRLADGSDANGGRNFRQSKAPDGWDTGPGGHGTVHRDGREAGAPAEIRYGRNKRTVWTIATQPYPEAHYATFPEKLVEPCVLAGTSERGCCPECGASWMRTVCREKAMPRVSSEERRASVAETTGRTDGHSDGPDGYVDQLTTTGWQPTCSHSLDPIPCTVLDPFAGSGTTLAVAKRLGRRSWGIELSATYVARDVARRVSRSGVQDLEDLVTPEPLSVQGALPW